MKRDMDLARSILFELEALPAGTQPKDFHVEGYDDPTVWEHVRLLNEAGLIDAIDCSTRHGEEWIPTRLTWDGHEFLNAARSDTVWNKAKATLTEKGIGLSLEFLKAALEMTVKGMLGAG